MAKIQRSDLPENGPSKPRLRNRRMKSRRLHGFQRLMDRLPVQVDVGQDWKRVPELESDEDPVFERRAKLLLAIPEALCKGQHSGTRPIRPTKVPSSSLSKVATAKAWAT